MGDQSRGKLNQFERVTDRFQDLGVSKSESRRAAKRFLKATESKSFSGNHYVEGGIIKAAQDEAEDLNFFSRALATGLAHEIQRPELAGEFNFQIRKDPNGYYISDDVDWAAINAERKKVKPNVDDLKCAHLVSAFVDSISDLQIASHYGGEYISGDASSKITRLKYERLLSRLGRDTHSISEFQESELDNSRAIRECVNSGERSFTDFIKLIDKRDSKKFKSFWAGVNTDSNALKAYYEENSRQGWISSLPSKAVRLAVCTTLGAVTNPIAGLALSAADTAVTERLMNGWRPHHFVERQLKPFVNS